MSGSPLNPTPRTDIAGTVKIMNVVVKVQLHPYFGDLIVTKKKMGYGPHHSGQLSLRPIGWEVGGRSPFHPVL